MPNAAKSGYSLLDARIPPSTLGRSLRVLGHMLVNKTPEWETEHGGRRLDNAVAAPNPLHKRGRKLRPSTHATRRDESHGAHGRRPGGCAETRSHHTTARRWPGRDGAGGAVCGADDGHLVGHLRNQRGRE